MLMCTKASVMCSLPFQLCDSFHDYLNDTVSKISYPGQASVTSGDWVWQRGGLATSLRVEVTS